MGKDDTNEKATGLPSYEAGAEAGSVEPTIEGTKMSRFVDSFRRNKNARMVTELVDDDGKPLEDQEPAQPALAMSLKPRHLQMIAIGGSIGG